MRLPSLSVMLLLACSAQGQGSFPFPDSSAIWVQYFEMMVTPPPLPEFEWTTSSNICISGQDTLISGTEYRKVERCDMGSVGALRDDSGQVFFLATDSVQEHLLYDFTVVIGDTLRDVFTDEGLAFGGGVYPVLIDMMVTQVGPDVDGRKVIHVNPIDGIGPGQIWIEGFGSPFGLFSKQDPLNVSGYWAGIACMSYLDTIWYYDPGGVYSTPGNCVPQYVGFRETVIDRPSVRPNPTDGVVFVDMGSRPLEAAQLTDLQGRDAGLKVSKTDGQVRMDLGTLPDGVYLLHLRSGVSTIVNKVIKRGDY